MQEQKKVESLDIEKWKKYKLKYIIDHHWIMYPGFMVLESFIKCSRSSKQNFFKKETYASMSKQTRGAILFIHHAKHLVRVHCDTHTQF